MNENLKSVKEMILWAIEHYADRDAFQICKKGGFYSISYVKFGEDVKALASYLTSKGYRGKHVAVMGENSYRWVVAYYAVVVAGATVVPVDKELTSQEVASVVRDSDSVAYIFSADYVGVAEVVRSTLPEVECYAMDDKRSVSGYTNMDSMMEQGAADKESLRSALEATTKESDICAIVFTSGTTGFSKGVMLSHLNIMSNIKSAYRMDDLVRFGVNRFSVLPMHHTYECNLGLVYGFYQGTTTSLNNSIKYVSKNIKMFRPTDLVLVPLISDALYHGIWANIRSQGKEKMVRRMIKFSNFLLKCGIDIRRKLFSKIHDALGGRVKMVFSGGAPVDPEITKGYIDLGFNFAIGYGITECSPLISGNISNDKTLAHTCGPAVDCNQLKINNPNEYGDGEILIKGDNVMVGYYKRPEATAEVMSGEWFHTGDMGRLDGNGNIIITGRIKNLIVLNNGKNIYPEEIESHIMKLEGVQEVIVSASRDEKGDELALEAEVFPNSEWAEQNPSVDIKRHISEQIDRLNGDLAYYKRISKVSFRDSEFLKTTTKKIKRHK